MRKYLSIILFISVGLGQDVMILKMGAQYEGEFLGKKSNKVHFKANNFSNLIKKSIKDIKELNQNGKLLIEDGEWLVEDCLPKLSTNLGASSKGHFKERGISKLKTTKKNYGKGSIIKANDYQIRFIAKPKLFHRGGAYLIDIKCIEEITLNYSEFDKILRTISNLSIPGTYCSSIFFNLLQEAVFKEALALTMIPVAFRGLLSFAQDKKNTIKMSNWDETKKKVYLEKLLSK